MGLKLPWAAIIEVKKPGCNRTIMGLKRLQVTIHGGGGASLQSNHYGIETHLVLVRNFSHQKLQSNHYGIETFTIATNCSPLKAVAIEPLWDWNYLFTQPKTHSPKVAIEPLWDWNSSTLSTTTGLLLVAIEPLWDWNHKLLQLKTKNTLQLQSNHYGIETRT